MNFQVCRREEGSNVAIHLTGLPRPAARARNDRLYEFIRSRPGSATHRRDDEAIQLDRRAWAGSLVATMLELSPA